MDPCIVPSGNSLLHLLADIMATGHPACLHSPVVVKFYVGVPGASHRRDSCIFCFPSLPTALPYRHWMWTVEQMILTAAGHNAPALNLGHLILDFCTYTRPAFVRFPEFPGRVLFLSAMVEVATDAPPHRFYYFPFHRAARRVVEDVVYSGTPEGYRYGGGTPAPAPPIRSTTKRVFFGGEAAAEGDRDSSCAVCLDEYEAGEVLLELLCGYRFHPFCIVEWLRQRPTCPLCRMPTPLDLK